jgi:hypothetical protein
MSLSPEEVLERRAEIAREGETGKLTYEEVGRRFLEADPQYGGGYLFLGRARADAEDFAGAAAYYWKALERMPSDPFVYVLLEEALRAVDAADPVPDRLIEIAAWLTARSEEIPDGIEEFFQDRIEDQDLDFQDPETFEGIAIVMEREHARPEASDALYPYAQLSRLHRGAPNALEPELIEDFCKHADRLIPLWRAMLREFDEGTYALWEDGLAMAIALLGETAGPEVLADLLEFVDRTEAPIWLHANWAVWRMGQRFPAETLAAFRAAAPGARLSQRCAIAEQIGELPESPEAAATVLELLDGFEAAARDPDALYLIAAAVESLDRFGRTAETERILRQFPSKLPRSARRELADVLEEGYLSRLAEEGLVDLTIQEICTTRVLMDDDEEDGFDEDFDDEDDFDSLEPIEAAPKPGRNDPCWCGSGKKYKKCHLAAGEEAGRSAGEEPEA